MKTSTALLSLAFLTSAFAAPSQWGKDGGKWNDNKKGFTSTYSVTATPDQVVNQTETGAYVFTGGLPVSNARGECGSTLRLTSPRVPLGTTISASIAKPTPFATTSLSSASEARMSPQPTLPVSHRPCRQRFAFALIMTLAAHVHEAPYGKTGPPRIAFPNPKKVPGTKNKRVSKGCLKGPFRTGIIDETTGRDTGAGSSVAQIEANPAGFFCDVHSSLALPGAVRGQLG